MSKPFLTVSNDFVKAFNASIEVLKDKETLVGIPAEDAGRNSDTKDAKGQTINNAALLAINEFGSPANNIPARAPVRIGLWDAKEKIAEQFKLAAQNMLSQGNRALDIYFERAGIIASQQIKLTINNQVDMEPPSKATLAARAAKGFRGVKALIVTGQMRNAITYVVRSKSLWR